MLDRHLSSPWLLSIGVLVKIPALPMKTDHENISSSNCGGYTRDLLFFLHFYGGKKF
jgi:hypothetical protein